MKYRSFDRRGFSLIELLIVVGLIGVISAIAVPMMGNLLGFYRLSGDARGISNEIAVAKMRAASEFNRVRVYVNLSSKNYYLQIWDKTNNKWTIPSSMPTTTLSSNVTFTKGSVNTPPPNTQTTIGQAALCTDDSGNPIAGTACVMFNSRGIPIDSTFSPTGDDALYVSDGTAVIGVTVAATGMIRMWRTPPTATPTWSLQ